LQDLIQNPATGILLFNVLIVWPLWRVLRRAGLNPLWALAVFIPLVGEVIVFGLLTFKRWPALPPRKGPMPRKVRRTA
jgi:type VI protein secretion system component VasK